MRARSLLLALALATGCLSIDYTEGRPFSRAAVDAIEVGVTTKSQVLEWFGAPDGFSDPRGLEALLGGYDLQPEDVLDLPFADVLVFRYSVAQLRARFYLVYLGAEVELLSDTLVVFFDDEERVVYYGYTREVPEGRRGDEEGAT